MALAEALTDLQAQVGQERPDRRQLLVARDLHLRRRLLQVRIVSLRQTQRFLQRHLTHRLLCLYPGNRQGQGNQ